MSNKDLWVFAYGSLMWRPDFPSLEARPAWIYGYHRALCVFSPTYRGTKEKPGLVAGLDRGGCCRGLAYRVAEKDSARVSEYLDQRELITGCYDRRFLSAVLDGGETVRVLTYVAKRGHPLYTGKLAPGEAAKLVVRGEGIKGTGLEYLENTVRHMDELGIGRGVLHRILHIAQGIKAG